MNKRINKLIEKQINRRPEGIKEISKCCPFGYPAVIKVYPFFYKRVFPTTYWLTCPYLNKNISRLEDSNWIDKLQNKVDSNYELKSKLEAAHINYAKQRMNMLDKKEIEKIKKISEDILYTLKNSGVGGIKDKKGIKCLHTHVADFLVNNLNPVGKIVFNKVMWPDECDICKELEINEKSSN
ncbi:MAG: DUF501 domain-containing protein [Halanaerobiales bacterium]|nr:DUF501 domain-containing protein [Halanaerobiales bacterium]